MNPTKHFNPLIIPFIVVLLLFISAGGFGVWAFMERSDYKNNSDQKSEKAVEAAKEEQKIQLEAEFAEKEKSPVDSYLGPSAFGSVAFDYPKTWSAYVEEKGTGATPIAGYLHPKFVPDITGDTSFALRFQVVEEDYSSVLKGYQSNIEKGTVSLTPYRHKADQTLLGSRIEGEIEKDKQGVIIILPIRDKSLMLWSEAPQFFNDFDKIILPSLTFES